MIEMLVRVLDRSINQASKRDRQRERKENGAGCVTRSICFWVVVGRSDETSSMEGLTDGKDYSNESIEKGNQMTHSQSRQRHNNNKQTNKKGSLSVLPLPAYGTQQNLVEFCGHYPQRQ